MIGFVERWGWIRSSCDRDAHFGEDHFLPGRGAHAQQSCWRVSSITKAVRRVGGHIDVLPHFGDQPLIAERDRDLALEDAEHLFEIMTMRRGPPPGGTCMSINVYFPVVSSPVTRMVQVSPTRPKCGSIVSSSGRATVMCRYESSEGIDGCTDEDSSIMACS